MTNADEIEKSQNDGWFSNQNATFGDRIAASREALGMTQKQLAERLGVSMLTLQSWEDDLGEPRANKLQMMAGLMNVSMAWLLTGEGDGLEAPIEVLAAPSDLTELMAEMRALRSNMTQAAERLGVLEKRLKTTLAVRAG